MPLANPRLHFFVAVSGEVAENYHRALASADAAFATGDALEDLLALREPRTRVLDLTEDAIARVTGGRHAIFVGARASDLALRQPGERVEIRAVRRPPPERRGETTPSGPAPVARHGVITVVTAQVALAATSARSLASR